MTEQHILPEKIFEIISRYLAGEASLEDIMQLSDWLNHDEKNRLRLKQLKNFWEAPVKMDEPHINFEKFIKRIDSQSNMATSRAKNIRISSRARIMMAAAAVALLFIIVSVSTHFNQPAAITETLSNVIEVPYGGKSKITLSDGSTVWINAGSKITYKDGFGTTTREIELEGEAYFDVTKNENIPFFVHTGLSTIKVYGTTFNVKAYADDDIVETTLDSGAISITSDYISGEIVMTPKQKVTIYKKIEPLVETLPTVKEPAIKLEKVNVEKVANIEPITAWKDNRLVFEHEPLCSLAKQLERRYNVNVVFKDEKFKTHTYTAALKEMPIEQVLEAISLTSPYISYTIKGTEVTLWENKSFIDKR